MQTLQVNTTLNLGDINVNPEYEALVPPQTEEEYNRLKDSIAEVGLYEPIVVNKQFTILDGHHRWRACRELETLPRFTVKHFETQLDEEIYVIETNVLRRQLNQYQKTLMGLKLEPLYREKAKQNQLSRNEDGRFAPNGANGTIDTDKLVSQIIGLGERTYQRAKYVLRNGTVNQLKKFKQGKKRAGSLYKEIIRKEKIAALKAEIPDIPNPQGPFDVIVVDPPWPYRGYGNKEYDADGNRADSPYPEMDIEDIKALELPTPENCVLWLWTTNMFMHEAYHVLEAWGFTPKTILTWVKDRMGLGRWLRNQTEHCILAIKGTPMVDLYNETTVLNAPNRGHSTKPDEFYELVDTLCIGTPIDWISRQEREGWTTFGTMEGS